MQDFGGALLLICSMEQFYEQFNLSFLFHLLEQSFIPQLNLRMEILVRLRH